MAAIFLSAIDDFLLDRVFQPIADRLHQWCGATPNGIAEFLGIGNVLFTIVTHVLRDPLLPDFGGSIQILTTGIDVFASIILTIIIVYPRNSEHSGMNYKRITLFFLRIFWLLCTLINLVTIPTLLYHAKDSLHVMGLCVSYAAQLCLWTASNFASLNKPPPRKQRESKLITWLRPRYAT